MKNTWFLDQDIQYFNEIIKNKSLTQAAQKLGINQPALSKSISRLEKKWGHSLIIRRREGISLSAQGEKFALKIKGLIEDFQSQAFNEMPKTLTFACHEALANTYMPLMLPLFAETFPEVKLDCTFATSLEVSHLVNEGKIDFGLVINPLKNADLTFKTIAKESVAIWAQDLSSTHQVNLVHPDMIMLEGFLRKKQVSNILKIPSYETIALILKNNPNWAGLLPQPVALRHNLKMVDQKFFEVQVNLVTRKDRLPISLQQKIFQLFKNI